MRIPRNLILAVVAVAACAVAAVAFAASTSASISGPFPASPAFGDQVTFGVTTDDPFPWLHVRCYQADVLVYTATHGLVPDTIGYGEPFTLGPTYLWQGGAAECVAAVYNVKRGALFKVLASVEFTVSA